MNKTNTPHDDFHLTDKEIDELAIFSGTYPSGSNEETKEQWRKAYRKAEAQTNAMIAKYGSIEKWYESGEGRFL